MQDIHVYDGHVLKYTTPPRILDLPVDEQQRLIQCLRDRLSRPDPPVSEKPLSSSLSLSMPQSQDYQALAQSMTQAQNLAHTLTQSQALRYIDKMAKDANNSQNFDRYSGVYAHHLLIDLELRLQECLDEEQLVTVIPLAKEVIADIGMGECPQGRCTRLLQLLHALPPLPLSLLPTPENPLDMSFEKLEGESSTTTTTTTSKTPAPAPAVETMTDANTKAKTHQDWLLEKIPKTEKVNTTNTTADAAAATTTNIQEQQQQQDKEEETNSPRKPEKLQKEEKVIAPVTDPDINVVIFGVLVALLAELVGFVFLFPQFQN